MTLTDLASIGSFVSGVAVVITLAFLLLQMRQNGQQMKMGELDAAQARFSEWRFAIANNRDVAEIWVKGLKDAALDEVDEYRFTNLLTDLCWSVYNAWDRHARSGILSDVPNPIPFLVGLLASQRARKNWREYESLYNSEFVAEVNAALAKLGTESR